MSFPTELMERRQWLVWRYEKKPGDKKPRKVPYYANGSRRYGEQGSIGDRQQLTDYATALVATADNFDGLGFAFLPGDGLIGVDIDGCFNTDDEQRRKRAEAIIRKCRSFTEFSPSGNGVHIIMSGECQTFKSNDVGIEVFCGRQFFTMTGNTHPESSGIIAPMTDELLARFRSVVDGAKESRKQQTTRPTTPVQQSATAKVESALAFISPDCGYDDWIKIGMAIHAELGAGALHVWDYWSRKGSKYCGEAAIQSHWRSFDGGGVTGATLFRLAMDAGWRAPVLPQARQPAPATAVTKPEPEQPPAVPPGSNGIDPQGIDIYSPLIDINGKGKPLATIENMAEIMRRIGASVRYNVICKRMEVMLPGHQFTVDNAANAALAHVVSWVNRFTMPTGSVQEYLLALADQNLYNPVANWINSRPWDGRSRFAEFCNTITEVSPVYLPDGRRMRDVILLRWMLSAVAAVFEPNGIVARGVLVLQGAQNIGKTHWLKRLAPKELDVIKDGITLNPQDKDSVKLCVSHWIVELGELDATFRKSDIASLKAFLTLDRDKLRLPYARVESEFARRTVFFASVNPRQFLHDSTGNSRFWTIECESINHRHDIDMQQAWAEIAELYRQGIGWYLSDDEFRALTEHNEDFSSSDPVCDMIDIGFEWGVPRSAWNHRMTATEICLAAGIAKPNKSDSNTASAHVVAKYGVKTVKSGFKYWLMPPKVWRNRPIDPSHPGDY